MGEFLQQEIPEHSGRGVQREELWYLFFSNAVEGQLFLHSVASVDHQSGVCRAEGSEAGRWAVILQHKNKKQFLHLSNDASSDHHILLFKIHTVPRYR